MGCGFLHLLAQHAPLWEHIRSAGQSLLSEKSGIEVDFLVDDVRVAIEAKASVRVQDAHLRGLREIQREHPRVKRRIVVSLDPRARRTEDGIEILPARVFAERLWADELLGS